jgi:hypothetical protein
LQETREDPAWRADACSTELVASGQLLLTKLVASEWQVTVKLDTSVKQETVAIVFQNKLINKAQA